MENEIVKSELITFMEENSLNKTTQELFIENFEPFFKQSKEWATKAKTLKITDVNQLEDMQSARVGRLALQKVRTGIEAKRKLLKEESLKTGKDIDIVAKFLTSLVVPTENYLEEQEKFIERENEKNAEALKTERLAALDPFNVETQFYDLAKMPQELFDKLLSDSKILHQAKIDNEAKEKAAELLFQRMRDREVILRKLGFVQNGNSFVLEGLSTVINTEITEKEDGLFDKFIEETSFEIAEIKRKKDEALQIENARIAKENKEKDELIKQQQKEAAEKQAAIDKAFNELIEERKKTLFALGFSLSNGKFIFDTSVILLDQILDSDTEKWTNIFEAASLFVSKRKKEIENIRIEKEAADKLEAEQALGDKPKFAEVVKDMEAIKAKFSFKSKKHKKLFVDTCALIDKIINHVNEKA